LDDDEEKDGIEDDSVEEETKTTNKKKKRKRKNEDSDEDSGSDSGYRIIMRPKKSKKGKKNGKGDESDFEFEVRRKKPKRSKKKKGFGKRELEQIKKELKRKYQQELRKRTMKLTGKAMSEDDEDIFDDDSSMQEEEKPKRSKKRQKKGEKHKNDEGDNDDDGSKSKKRKTSKKSKERKKAERSKREKRKKISRKTRRHKGKDDGSNDVDDDIASDDESEVESKEKHRKKGGKKKKGDRLEDIEDNSEDSSDEDDSEAKPRRSGRKKKAPKRLTMTRRKGQKWEEDKDKDDKVFDSESDDKDSDEEGSEGLSGIDSDEEGLEGLSGIDSDEEGSEGLSGIDSDEEDSEGLSGIDSDEEDSEDQSDDDDDDDDRDSGEDSAEKSEAESEESEVKVKEEKKRYPCTVCFKQYTDKFMYQHPLLQTAICRNCIKKYNVCKWPKDEDGHDNYCRWSAKKGDDLWVCDTCPRAYEPEIIRRNMGEKYFKKYEDAESWKCFVCAPEQLDSFKKDWREYGKKKKKKKKKERKSDVNKPKGKYRRNINKILDDEDLNEETKKAMKLQMYRQELLKDREEKYKAQGAKYNKNKQKMCLNPYHSKVEEPVFAAATIGKLLKKHQIAGTRFIWSNICDIKDNKKKTKGTDEDGNSDSSEEDEEENVVTLSEGTGCILAHLMGLGKTLQSITIIQAFLASGIGRLAMIICPVNVLTNWKAEFEKWLDEDERPSIVSMAEVMRSNKARLRALEKWRRQGGVLIIGYEMIRNLCEGKRVQEKMRDRFQSLLLEMADLVVVDEGHRIKNSKTGLSKVLSQIGTQRRVILTGTPLQNNLMEYFFMIDFVRPNFLGTPKDFRNRFESPILNGQCVDSNADDVRLMRERAFVLHNKVQAFVHRRGYRDIAHELPEKSVYTLFVSLSPLQKQLYAHYLGNITRRSLFQDYHSLNKIWNHPQIIRLAYKEWYRTQNQKKERAMLDLFINDDDEDEDEDAMLDDDLDKVREKTKAEERKLQLQKKREKIDAIMHGVAKNGLKHDWFKSILPKNEDEDEDEEDLDLNITTGPKFQVAIELMERIIAQGEKVIIFSQSLLTLDLLETAMEKHLDYYKNENFFRIDGSIKCDVRQKDIDEFNKPDSEQKVFLLSTKAGSLGINLIGANHAIIFDSSWNPSHDLQAIFRIYRFGQKKNVYVYRLVSHDTMEQKIYERQLTKRGLALRVVDEKQVQRVFQTTDLQDLYRCEFPMTKYDAIKSSKDAEVTEEEQKTLEAIASKSEQKILDEMEKIEADGAWQPGQENDKSASISVKISKNKMVMEDEKSKTGKKEAEKSGDGEVLGADKKSSPSGSKLSAETIAALSAAAGIGPDAKSSVYNPYENCRKELPQGSLMWFVLARYGNMEQQKDALAALKKYQSYIRMEKKLKSTPRRRRLTRSKSKAGKKKKSSRRSSRKGKMKEESEEEEEEEEEDEETRNENLRKQEIWKAKLALAKMAMKRKGDLKPNHWMNGFHMPNLLLEHIDAEALNEEERKRALENFEKDLERQRAEDIRQQQQQQINAFYSNTPEDYIIAASPPENWPLNNRIPEMLEWEQPQIFQFLDSINMPMLKSIWLHLIVAGGQLFFLHGRSPELSNLPSVLRNKFLYTLMNYVMAGNERLKMYQLHMTQDGNYKIFFFNTETKTSQWNIPNELKFDFGKGQEEFYKRDKIQRQALLREQEFAHAQQQQWNRQNQYQGGYPQINQNANPMYDTNSEFQRYYN